MTIVTSYDWESDTWTHNGDNAARKAWREAVADDRRQGESQIARVQRPRRLRRKLVLAGDVELLADGTAKVASQSNGTARTMLSTAQCDCNDFAKAPHSFCKHRLSAAIARRAQELTKAKLA